MRSGTTMLTTMLNSHPNLKCYAEESADVLPTLNENEGINIKYPHLAPGEITSLADSYKIIHLVRTNVFQTAISNYINDNKAQTKTPTAHIFSKNENLYYITKQDKHDRQIPKANRQSHKNIETDKIIVDYNYVKDAMYRIHNNINKQIEYLNGHPNVLTLTYEDLTSNGNDITTLDSDISTQLCDFLGVTRYDMYCTTMKVNDNRYEKYIANWEELQSLRELIEE